MKALNKVDWFSLTPRQQTIRFSVYSYYFILCGVKPFHYLEWNE